MGKKNYNKYDWEKLKADVMKSGFLRSETIMVTMPTEQPTRYLDNSFRIEPVRNPNSEKTIDVSELDLIKAFSKAMDKSSAITPEQLSAKLGFDVEAMVKPKNNQDIFNILNEALNQVTDLNDNIDAIVGTHSREHFSAGEHKFIQYMDKDDNAHILWLDRDIKEKMLNENLINLNPWVEVFTIDGSYCYFTNSHGKQIGRIKGNYDSPVAIQIFESMVVNNNRVTYKCISSQYPYECEREVIKWLVKTGLFSVLKDFKGVSDKG